MNVSRLNRYATIWLGCGALAVATAACASDKTAARQPSDAAQVSPEDRWRIVAYIRALQLSQNATVADAAGEKIPSPPKLFKEPGSGATPVTDLPPSSYTGIELK